MIRTIEYKMYPTPIQTQWLDACFRLCCRTYNWALECRKEHYIKTGKTLTSYDQNTELTKQRAHDPELASYPVLFERSSLRRVDIAFKHYFQRIKEGNKPGFPRFKSSNRFSSVEALQVGNYLRPKQIYVPNLGLVRARKTKNEVTGTQKALRIIRRASGWYAQVVIDDQQSSPDKTNKGQPIGIDLGLKVFATLSDGSKIANPRWIKGMTAKLSRLHQQVSSKIKSSRKRLLAIRKLARAYERLRNLRKNFCHHVSKQLVTKYDLIGTEDLNIKQLVEKKDQYKLAKSILDACWGLLKTYISYKAASAGKWHVRVEAKGTTQECSRCHKIVPKTLADRVHKCKCGYTACRDENAANNVLQRAIRAVGADFKPIRRKPGG